MCWTRNCSIFDPNQTAKDTKRKEGGIFVFVVLGFRAAVLTLCYYGGDPVGQPSPQLTHRRATRARSPLAPSARALPPSGPPLTRHTPDFNLELAPTCLGRAKLYTNGTPPAWYCDTIRERTAQRGSPAQISLGGTPCRLVWRAASAPGVVRPLPLTPRAHARARRLGQTRCAAPSTWPRSRAART